MAVNTTPNSILTIVSRLRRVFGQFQFTETDKAYWSPSTQTVFYRAITNNNDAGILLHELGHALLGHRDFTDDITLVRCESDAWNYAKTMLAPQFGITIDDEFADINLETYREWLHKRSLCPRCNQTGLQTGTQQYECINCSSVWTVNDARACQLRRRLR